MAVRIYKLFAVLLITINFLIAEPRHNLEQMVAASRCVKRKVNNKGNVCVINKRFGERQRTVAMTNILLVRSAAQMRYEEESEHRSYANARSYITLHTRFRTFCQRYARCTSRFIIHIRFAYHLFEHSLLETFKIRVVKLNIQQIMSHKILYGEN